MRAIFCYFLHETWELGLGHISIFCPTEYFRFNLSVIILHFVFPFVQSQCNATVMFSVCLTCDSAACLMQKKRVTTFFQDAKKSLID
ncbi:hypothetical protein VNO80_29375 [Phaseolus coccineus]|uniref:Uncharacterized protein n=1 Tax=Phaseolus coccineus TaxID=3886 RepID=A0AAN9LAU5_PHACN